jgi:hypothetical protein
MRRLAVLITLAMAACGGSVAEAANPPPGIDAAIRRGIPHLKGACAASPKTGESILAALALVKAGEDINSAEIQSVIAGIQERCAAEIYKPGTHHFYAAGLELMLFEAIDPERYRGEMEKVLAYMLKGQLTSGAWFYPDQQGTGDTSITQYAALGMWAAERAGLKVPKEAWDKMALWHLKTQVRDGGFSYHPGEQQAESGSQPSLTVGGAASLMLAQLHLHGGRERAKAKVPRVTEREEQTGKVFGVLEPVRTDASAAVEPNANPDRGYAVKASYDAIQKSVDRASAWATANWRLPPGPLWRMYFLYSVERMAALGDLKAVGPHDWYAEGATWLLKEQQPDGSWTDNGGPVIATAFSVLFLAKATSKMLGRTYDVPQLGGGLLAGGRGLPDDLGTVNVTGGNVEKRTAGGPLDELLARLETVSGAEVPEVQNAVLEAIRFGDREKLIGQRERLRRLVADPRVEVRRTAYWALGRGGELVDVPLLIDGLSDQDPGVAIEAHNALCVLSRRPLAFGLSGDPTGGLPDGATDAQKDAAIADWRQKAIAAWTDWYRRVAPYEERDGLGLFFKRQN